MLPVNLMREKWFFGGGGVRGTVPADSVRYEWSQASENMKIEMQYMDGTRVDFDLAPGSVVARERGVGVGRK